MLRSIQLTKDFAIPQEVLWLIGVAIVAALGFWWWSMSGSSGASTVTGDTNRTAQQQTVGETWTSGVVPLKRENASTEVVHATDIASIVADIPEASSFAELFSSTGVSAALKTGGPYTVFVSSNKSISQLPAGMISNMSAAEKKRFVQYSVIGDRKVNIDAMRSGSIPSLTREPLNFEVGLDGVARVNGATVVKTFTADNGVVYLLDRVLLPPKSN